MGAQPGMNSKRVRRKKSLVDKIKNQIIKLEQQIEKLKNDLNEALLLEKNQEYTNNENDFTYLFKNEPNTIEFEFSQPA